MNKKEPEYLKATFLNIFIISVKLTLASSEFSDLNVKHLSEWKRMAYTLLYLR